MNEIISSNPEKTLNYNPILELDLLNKKGLILSDIHIPFYDKNALNIALQRGKHLKIDFIYLNGDIIDFYAISRFDRNPERKFLKPEIDKAINILKEIRKAFPKIEIFFKIGNHEDRLLNYIWSKSPELTGLQCLNIESLLNFEELKIKKVESGQASKIGKLFVIHGHEFKGGFFQVNTARNIRLKASNNILQAHFHRTNDDISTAINGEVTGGYTQGCLCELHPAYMPFNQWNLGFIELTVFKDGGYLLENRKIINGNIY